MSMIKLLESPGSSRELLDRPVMVGILRWERWLVVEGAGQLRQRAEEKDLIWRLAARSLCAAIFGLFVHHTVALFKVYQRGAQTRGDGEEDKADMGHECYLTEWTSKVALCRGGGEVIWSQGLDVCQRLSLSVPHCKLSHHDLHLIGAGTQDRPQAPDRWTMARAGLRRPGKGYALHVSLIS
ncbi:hypothetical protein SRHO_G00165710 [Serrasalmus rhombeus]